MKKQTNKQSLLLCSQLRMLGFFVISKKSRYSLMNNRKDRVVTICKHKPRYSTIDLFCFPPSINDVTDIKITESSYRDIIEVFNEKAN